MLSTHYRQPIDWTFSQLKYCEMKLDSWQSSLHLVRAAMLPSEKVIAAIEDDLNIHKAIMEIEDSISEGTPGALSLAKVAIEFLGIDLARFWDDFREAAGIEFIDESKVESLITTRLEARKATNWAESDRIRDELAAMGIAIKDNKDGTTSWEVKR